MGRVSEIVKHLIIINVIFYIASMVFGELMYDLLLCTIQKIQIFSLATSFSHVYAW